MQTLAIDNTLFQKAFGRDVDFHDAYPQSTYLDRDSGEILWVYEEDNDAHTEMGIAREENAATRQSVATAPDRYLEIPGLNHGDHHDLLRAFLDSDWTDNEEVKDTVQAAYFGSIGGWKKAVGDESVYFKFCDFRDQKIQRMAENFLRGHGIDPQWQW